MRYGGCQLMNINIAIDKIFEFCRKISPLLVAIAIFSGVLLFMPSNLLYKLHLMNIQDTYGENLGICFLFSTVLIIVIILEMIFHNIINYFKNQRLTRNLAKSFNKLDAIQKEIIISFYKSKKKSGMLKMTEGNTILLVNSGFIGRPAQLSDGEYCEYFLQPWVVDYFNSHPEFV